MSSWFFGKTLPARHANQRQEGARAALIVLSCINLLNFADRYVPSSVKSLLKRDLHLTDTQTSLPSTGMVLVYMCTAVVFGWIADRRLVDRRVLLASGVAFWSLATALAGVAHVFPELLIFRSLVGVGEAAFMTTAAPMLADFYPIADRNLVFMIFGLCGPLGGALGFVIGAVVGPMYGWRVAFFVCGIPGLVVSLLILTLNDPSRGINDPTSMKEGLDLQRRKSALADVVDIFRVPHWRVAVMGMIAVTFTVGGLADWYDAFLLRMVPGTTVGRVGLALGACTMLGGLVGAPVGARVAQSLSPRWQNAYLRVPALFMIPAAVLIGLCVNITSSQSLCYLFCLLSWIFFWAHMAPLNVITCNSMPVHLRSRSGGLQVFLTHVLGDVISPPIIGAISDSTGSLQLGMQLCWIMPCVAILAWGIGSFLLPDLPQAADDASPKAGDAGAASPSLRSLFFGTESAAEDLPESSLVSGKKADLIYGTNGA